MITFTVFIISFSYYIMNRIKLYPVSYLRVHISYTEREPRSTTIKSSNSYIASILFLMTYPNPHTHPP